MLDRLVKLPLETVSLAEIIVDLEIILVDIPGG